MNLQQIVNIKLKKELFEDLHADFSIDADVFKDLINRKVDQYNYQIKFDDKPIQKISDKNDIYRCCARTWNSHYGGRCPYRKVNSDYCKKHQKIIDEYGYLIFKRYDEPRPTINQKGNKIPWYNYDSITMLNIIIQYHSIQYLRLIQ